MNLSKYIEKIKVLKTSDLIFIVQMSTGFFPILLYNTDNYLEIEKFLLVSGIINAYFFGLFVNSSVFVVNRFQSFWKDYLIGNLFCLTIVFILLILFNSFFETEYSNTFIILSYFIAIRNSIFAVILTLGLFRYLLLIEIISTILLLLAYLLMIVFPLNDIFLLSSYFLYISPLLFFIIRLLIIKKWKLKFDYKNWFSGYLDPLANGLLVNIPRLIILESNIVGKSLYLIYTRFSFAFISLSSQLFWARTTRFLSKEFYFKKFGKTKTYVNFSIIIIIMSVISIIIFKYNPNPIIYVSSLILVFLSLILPMTFLRYKKSAIERSIFFGVLAFLLTINVQTDMFKFFLLVSISSIATTFYIIFYIRYSNHKLKNKSGVNEK